MARYGNIMIVFNADVETMNNVKTILIENGADFENINDLYFIESNSKKNTAIIIAEIKKANIDFILFHNHISDGSRIEAIGIEPDVLKRIRKILFE